MEPPAQTLSMDDELVWPVPSKFLSRGRASLPGLGGGGDTVLVLNGFKIGEWENVGNRRSQSHSPRESRKPEGFRIPSSFRGREQRPKGHSSEPATITPKSVLLK